MKTHSKIQKTHSKIKKTQIKKTHGKIKKTQGKQRRVSTKINTQHIQKSVLKPKIGWYRYDGPPWFKLLSVQSQNV